MIARLGDVLYWAACGVAVLMLIAGGTFVFIARNDSLENAASLGLMFAAFAVVSWLVGRACRYVLTGR